jgi:nucleoside-diphosphate-sugar epimerase
MIEQIRQGRAVRIHPGNRPHLSPAYIDDVANVFERAVAEELTGVYNVAGETVISLHDLACSIGANIGVAPVFEEAQQEHGDLAGDNSALERVLGAGPMVSLAEGLRRTCKDPSNA